MRNPSNISCQQRRFIDKHLRNIESGNLGEDAALEYEVGRHLVAGGKYIKDIDPNASEDSKTGCDILSRTMDGKALYTEVKSSAGGIDEKFHITKKELDTAAEVERDGGVYVRYRVLYSCNIDKRTVVPISMEYFRKYFSLTPERFAAELKEA